MNDLDVTFSGPPHNIRHSQPSTDAASGRRTLEEIRRRGRWSALSSVQRYTKDFLLCRHDAKLPGSVKLAGLIFLSDPRAALIDALRDGPSSPLARILVSALASRSDVVYPAAPDLPSMIFHGETKSRVAKKRQVTKEARQRAMQRFSSPASDTSTFSPYSPGDSL